MTIDELSRIENEINSNTFHYSDGESFRPFHDLEDVLTDLRDLKFTDYPKKQERNLLLSRYVEASDGMDLPDSERGQLKIAILERYSKEGILGDVSKAIEGVREEYLGETPSLIKSASRLRNKFFRKEKHKEDVASKFKVQEGRRNRAELYQAKTVKWNLHRDLLVATLHGRQEEVAGYLSRDVDLNVSVKPLGPLITYAVVSGSVETADLLAGHTTREHLSPLLKAIELGNADMLAMLGSTHGFYKHIVGKDDLFNIAYNSEHPQIRETICEIDINRALMYKSSQGDVEAMEQLIENGADVNSRNSKGAQPIHYAAGKRQLESLKLLVGKYGVDPDAKTSSDSGERYTASVVASHNPEWVEGLTYLASQPIALRTIMISKELRARLEPIAQEAMNRLDERGITWEPHYTRDCSFAEMMKQGNLE